MNYTLNKPMGVQQASGSTWATVRRLLPILKGEERNLAKASLAIFVTTVSALIIPVMVSRTIDTYIVAKDFYGVLVNAGLLLGIFVIGLVAQYLQTIVMGGVGRRVLFGLRNEIFGKLQSLPVAFFNQNKSGDLISRINSDTDKLNMFFSQALMQFVGNFFLIAGAGIFLVSLNPRLGGAALLPAAGVLVITQLISGWVKRQNAKSLKSLGGMSGEIQESLNNFKVIVAFNRLDYFRKKFNEVNEANYRASIGAGIANNVFMPMYGLAAALAQLIVLALGVTFIAQGQVTLGLLIGFFLYVNNFYLPLRQLASVWATMQQAMAAFDRIAEVLSLESDMTLLQGSEVRSDAAVLSFQNVSFRYPDSPDVLKHVNFSLEKGKTYALVGPTGGGKTTTASLMARLYDPSEGLVLLDGKDIRGFAADERARKIGFILQEPFLFTGTVLENIFYGNPEAAGKSSEEMLALIKSAGLDGLLTHFESGLETKIQTGGESVSLGQRQLIAFVRAVLRKPEVLILDEATANIDTVTEQLLQVVLEKLPSTTTKVVIAHRLNTIENADEIFFVNGGEVTAAGSMEQAVEMLMQGKRQS